MDHSMVGIGEVLYVCLPSQLQHRILHPVSLRELKGQLVTAMAEDPKLQIEEKKGLLLFYNPHRDFMQRPTRVETLERTEETLKFEARLVGDPISAESRECYRVSTAARSMTASFGKEPACPVLDVSQTGFSVIAAGECEIGELFCASLNYEGKEFKGDVSVQSVRKIDDSRVRYGLQACDQGNPNKATTSVLEWMTNRLQREQLRRMSKNC